MAEVQIKPSDLDTLRKQLWQLWRSPKSDPILKALAKLAWEQIKHMQNGTGGPDLPRRHKRTLRDLEAAIIERNRKGIRVVR